MRKIFTGIIIVIGLLSLIGIAFAKEFHGTVQALPDKGYIGQWKINDKTVYVTEETTIKEKHGKPTVGSYVEVEGVTCEGKFIAAEIEIGKRQ
jgi:hypothetical protein